MTEIDHKAIVAEEVQHDFDILSERLKIAEQEASITTAQLHQIQEDLEYYLLLSRQQAKMLKKVLICKKELRCCLPTLFARTC